MELYEVALQMLLERRDRERRIERVMALTRTDKTLLLRDIAYWLIRNAWTSAPAGRVRERVATKLAGMVQVDASADEVYRMLLERSGLLREPVAGQTDFVHRTFQEYLAAAEAVATDDIGALITNAYSNLWSDVVVMAAGHATAAQRVELIRGLLDRADREQDPQLRRLADALRLLAAACLETSPEVPQDLRRQVQRAAEALLPPKTMAMAQVLARSGTFTLDLLARAEPRTAAEVAATVRAAAGTGDPAALPLLARFGRDTRKPVVRELLRAWPRFDPDQYARTVLPAYPLDSEEWFEIRDLRLIPALHHLANLRRLRVITLDGSPVDPAFVADLPDLEGLILSDVTDLQPLAGTAITRFWQPMGGLVDRPPLSLAPLAELPELTELAVWGRRTADLAALRGHDQLVVLSLGQLGSRDALAGVPQLPGLGSVGIGGSPDLDSLQWLRFLNSPFQIIAYACPALDDISILTRWKEAVRSVGLNRCPAVDIAPLSSLRRLEDLSLLGSGPLELSPIAGLPGLRRIHLGLGPLPDLRPLKDSPALAVLEAHGVPEVDLGPLAGREGLTVEVDRSATVHGAARLGAGSRVVRR
jgi:hypothetical protein